MKKLNFFFSANDEFRCLNVGTSIVGGIINKLGKRFSEIHQFDWSLFGRLRPVFNFWLKSFKNENNQNPNDLVQIFRLVQDRMHAPMYARARQNHSHHRGRPF